MTKKPATTQIKGEKVALTADQIGRIHDGLAAAGLSGVKVASMRLTPAGDSPVGGIACHSVKLPDGSYKIVCN